MSKKKKRHWANKQTNERPMMMMMLMLLSATKLTKLSVAVCVSLVSLGWCEVKLR